MVQQLEPSFITGFRDLCMKLMSQFRTNMLANKISTKLFSITQIGGEFTRAYLKMYNKEMLKVEELIEIIASEAMINGVREHFI